MLLGSLQGLIVSLLLAINPQYKKKSNFFLSVLVLTISVQNISNGLIDIGYEFIEYWPLSWTLLVPFSLRYFVICLIDSSYKVKVADYRFLIPFGAQFSFKVLVFILFLIDKNLVFDNESIIQKAMISFELVAVIWCFYVVVGLLRKLGSYEENLVKNFSSIEGKSLSWLKNTLIAVLVIWVFWTFTFAFHIVVQELDYLSYLNWISIALITYWIAYSIIIRRKVFEAPSFVSDQDASDGQKKLPIRSAEHYAKIISLMKDDYLYRQSDLSMDMLAEKMGLSNGYVSQIINQKEGKNFFEFINGYRVEEVMKKMEDPKFAHFSLLGIALDSGFTSKSTFNAVFKKIASMTPSEYQKARTVRSK